MYETYRKVYYPFMYVYSILYALCIITAQIAELFLCVELIFVFLFLYLLSSYSSSYASSKCVSAIHYAPTTLTMTTSKYFFNSLFAIFIFVVQGWRSMTLYYLFFFSSFVRSSVSDVLKFFQRSKLWFFLLPSSLIFSVRKNIAQRDTVDALVCVFDAQNKK